MNRLLCLLAPLLTLPLLGCGPSPMPEKYLNTAEARAQAMCECPKDPLAASECVDKVKADHVEPEGRPDKQEVTEGSWAAYKGFGDAGFKCEMAAISAANAVKGGS